jgi:hypothetical protein
MAFEKLRTIVITAIPKPRSRERFRKIAETIPTHGLCGSYSNARPPILGPIESSTNARVMDPLDRSSRWQRKVLPQNGLWRAASRADVVT